MSSLGKVSEREDEYIVSSKKTPNSNEEIEIK